MPLAKDIIGGLLGAATGVGGSAAFDHLSGQGANMTPGDRALQGVLTGGLGATIGTSIGRKALLRLASKDRIIDGVVKRTISPLQAGSLAGITGASVLAPTWVPATYRSLSKVMDDIVKPTDHPDLKSRLLAATGLTSVPADTLQTDGTLDQAADAGLNLVGRTAKSYAKHTGSSLKDLAAPGAALALGTVGALGGDRLASHLYPELEGRHTFAEEEAQERKRHLSSALLATLLGTGAAYGGYQLANNFMDKKGSALLKTLRTVGAAGAGAGASHLWQSFGDSSKLNDKTKLQRDLQAGLLGALASSSRIRGLIAPHINADTIVKGVRTPLNELATPSILQRLGRLAGTTGAGAGAGYFAQDGVNLIQGDYTEDHTKGLLTGGILGGLGGIIRGKDALSIKAKRLLPYLAVPGASYFGRGAIGSLTNYPKDTLGEKMHKIEDSFNHGKGLDEIIHDSATGARAAVAKKTREVSKSLLEQLNSEETSEGLAKDLAKAHPDAIRKFLKNQAIAGAAGLAGSLGGWELGNAFFRDDDKLSDEERLARRGHQNTTKLLLSTLLGTGAAYGTSRYLG